MPAPSPRRHEPPGTAPPRPRVAPKAAPTPSDVQALPEPVPPYRRKTADKKKLQSVDAAQTEVAEGSVASASADACSSRAVSPSIRKVPRGPVIPSTKNGPVAPVKPHLPPPKRAPPKPALPPKSVQGSLAQPPQIGSQSTAQTSSPQKPLLATRGPLLTNKPMMSPKPTPVTRSSAPKVDKEIADRLAAAETLEREAAARLEENRRKAKEQERLVVAHLAEAEARASAARKDAAERMAEAVAQDAERKRKQAEMERQVAERLAAVAEAKSNAQREAAAKRELDAAAAAAEATLRATDEVALAKVKAAEGRLAELEARTRAMEQDAMRRQAEIENEIAAKSREAAVLDTYLKQEGQQKDFARYTKGKSEIIEKADGSIEQQDREDKFIGTFPVPRPSLRKAPVGPPKARVPMPRKDPPVLPSKEALRPSPAPSIRKTRPVAETKPTAPLPVTPPCSDSEDSDDWNRSSGDENDVEAEHRQIEASEHSFVLNSGVLSSPRPAPRPHRPASDTTADKLQMIVEEIMTTEQTYVRNLSLVQEKFIPSLREVEKGTKQAMNAEIEAAIFCNLNEIHLVHKMFLQQLEKEVTSWGNSSSVGGLFLELAPALYDIYPKYITNFEKSSDVLKSQMLKEKFKAKVIACEADPACGSLTLAAFLLEPIQRVPRFQLLLNEYLKKAPSDHHDREQVERALEKMKNVSETVNNDIKKYQSEARMEELEPHFPSNFELLVPNRLLLKEGTAMKSSRKGLEERAIFLFSDCFIYCKKSSGVGGDKYGGIKQFDLGVMQGDDYDGGGSVEGLENAISIRERKKAFLLGFSRLETKLAWLRAIIQAKMDAATEIKKGGQKTPSSTESIRDQAAAPLWIPDSSVTMCQVCAATFNFTRRRHHCRRCGKVICGACSSKKLPINYDEGKLGRVCDECFTAADIDEIGVDGETTRAKLELKKTRMISSHKQTLIEAAHGVSKDDREIVMAGYLLVKQSGMLKSWKRHWFVLKRDFCLFAYKAPEDVVALFSLPLPGYSITSSEEATMKVDKENSWIMNHAVSKPVSYSAETDFLKDEWIKHLTAATKAEFVLGDDGEEVGSAYTRRSTISNRMSLLIAGQASDINSPEQGSKA